MYIANIIVLLSLQQHGINNSSKKLICHCTTSPQWRGLRLSQEVESTSLVLLNTGNMLQAVYNLKWIYQRASQHATKMYGMLYLMRENYRQLSTAYIPSVTIVMVCIIHAWMYLSVLAWVWQTEGAWMACIIRALMCVRDRGLLSIKPMTMEQHRRQ